MSEKHIDPHRVIKAFHRSATAYDEYAVLQREIADRLIDHLAFTRLEPRRILDVGCGTGYCTELLHKRYRRARIHAVDIAGGMVQAARQRNRGGWLRRGYCRFAIADAQTLPFADASFDLVCSNLVMQWVSDPGQMIREMRRVLAPGGLMLFSTFGRRTLAELRQSLAQIEHERAGLVLPFPDVTSLGNMLTSLEGGLAVEMPVTDTDLFTLTYPDTMALVRELKNWGASSSAIAHRPGGLYGRGMLRKLAQHYAASHRMPDGRIRASFEALYAQAWHAESPYHGKKTIPIQSAGQPL